MMKLVAALLLCLISYSADACPFHDKMMRAFPAHFEYMINVSDPTTSSVTEESFQQHFFDVFFQNYQDMQNKLIMPVVPDADWVKPYFTAYTAEIDGFVKMGFWGGMARIPGMNSDAVALITCHEVGHVLGGKPYFKNPNFQKFSSEGQADYYSTAVCLKKYFTSIDSTMDELNITQPASAIKHCQKLQSKKEQAICYRSIRAINGFIAVLGHLKKNNGNASLEGKDTSVASETYVDDYPGNQCRVDTLLAGLFNLPRPSCWFKD